MRPVALDDALQRLEAVERLLNERVAEAAFARFPGQGDEPVVERRGRRGDWFLGRLAASARRLEREHQDEKQVSSTSA